MCTVKIQFVLWVAMETGYILYSLNEFFLEDIFFLI